MSGSGFAGALLAWHARHGRHDLPWQHPRSAYRVWVSEIMLQQTQVKTVIAYFKAFMARFPDLPSLAAADEQDVLQYWAGLGYYARARNLHRAAQLCMQRHGGELPRDFEALLALPGIGRSTAGAILSQAHDGRFAILDGNVKRVLSRYFAVAGDAGSTAVTGRLWELSESLLPDSRMADYTQALMDLGATVCTRSRPACERCPLAPQCLAHRDCTVAEYPGRKPRKTLPERRVHVLLLQRGNGALLLERRPASGIWGGLHSLPEADDLPAALELARQLARPATGPIALAPIRHVFTHFKLDLHPLYWPDCTPCDGIGDNDRRIWLPRTQLAQVGLPAPIKTLLQELP